jgi:hypothetical protein
MTSACVTINTGTTAVKHNLPFAVARRFPQQATGEVVVLLHLHRPGDFTLK